MGSLTLIALGGSDLRDSPRGEPVASTSSIGFARSD